MWRVNKFFLSVSLKMSLFYRDNAGVYYIQKSLSHRLAEIVDCLDIVKHKIHITTSASRFFPSIHTFLPYFYLPQFLFGGDIGSLVSRLMFTLWIHVPPPKRGSFARPDASQPSIDYKTYIILAV